MNIWRIEDSEGLGFYTSAQNNGWEMVLDVRSNRPMPRTDLKSYFHLGAGEKVSYKFAFPTLIALQSWIVHFKFVKRMEKQGYVLNEYLVKDSSELISSSKQVAYLPGCVEFVKKHKLTDIEWKD